MSNLNKTTSLAISAKQAAAYLGTTTDNLKRSRCEGRLWGREAPPFIKAGARVLYKRSSLSKWFDEFQEFNNNATTEWSN